MKAPAKIALLVALGLTSVGAMAGEITNSSVNANGVSNTRSA